MITKQGTGQGIIVPAVAKLEKLGTEIRTGVFMEKILRSDTGCVTGVEVREGSSSKTPVTMPNETKMFRSVFLYNVKKSFFDIRIV